MNTPRIHQNPFDLTKASDFSDEQIHQYWVDLAGQGGLEDLFKPIQQMPMLLLGGKGSGKTHLMRHYSSSVQKLRFRGNLLLAAQSEHLLGIYLRAEGLNVGRFGGKGFDDDQWCAVFSYYFELWLASHLLKNVQECAQCADGVLDEPRLVSAAKSLFSTPQPDSITRLQDLIEHLAVLRRSVDHVVSNCATKRTTLQEIEICVSPGQLVFELPELIVRHSTAFSDVMFVYMIDEIENFTAPQQRFLNSLIRYRRGPTSIKVGARLYGIRTKQTLGSGEEIRRDAEYEQVELDGFLREHTDEYAGLARDLIAKRLQKAHLTSPSIVVRECVDEWFAAPDSTDNFGTLSLELVETYDKKQVERPYFVPLRKHISEVIGKKADHTTQAMIDEIIQSLQLPNYPLLEKLNIYLFYKGWCNLPGLVALGKKIGAAAESFLEGGKEAAPAYFQALDHFKSDILAQLYRDCGRGRGIYAGLDTLIHLSQGIPRNLLSLLKHIYRRSFFAGEQPFQDDGIISIRSQVEGVRDAAAWFWEDAQPDSHGPEVRAAVEALAELFREVRYSPKPAECDLGTFTVAANMGTKVANRVLEHAENWSYLIRVRDGGVNRNNSASIDDKFQLSPMLAPRWGVSEHRRGTIPLAEPMFNAIFDPEFRATLPEIKKDRLKGMVEPHRKTQALEKDQQDALF